MTKFTTILLTLAAITASTFCPVTAQHAFHPVAKGTSCDNMPAQSVSWVNINHHLNLVIRLGGGREEQGGLFFPNIEGSPVRKVTFTVKLEGNGNLFLYAEDLNNLFNDPDVDLEPIPGHPGYFAASVKVSDYLFPPGDTLKQLFVFYTSQDAGKATISDIQLGGVLAAPNVNNIADENDCP